MFEKLNDSQKLNVCTVIWEELPDIERREWESENAFKETCIQEGITIGGKEDNETRTMKLAESITMMADSLDELLKTGINRKLLVLYIHDTMGSKNSIGKTKIEIVLDAIEEFIKETKEA